jgi:hypothetical protein
MPLTQVSPGLLDSNAQYYGFKNRLINSAMVIDQRNNGASVTLDNTGWKFAVDRFGAYEDTDGVMTAEQVEDAPTGFYNSLKFTTTTADSSLAATQRVNVRQCIEGYNTADLAFGTAGASTITVSFWVKSSLTGTFGAVLINNNGTRTYPFSYTINSANTWEQKTITVSGDQSGTWLTTNGIGLQVMFSLGVGSTYRGTAGSWVSSELYSVTGETPVIGTLNATWQITGVQLEKGSTATSFDYRPYGTELMLCQRYYEVYYQDPGAVSPAGTYYNASNYFAFWYFKQEKRAAATVTRTSGSWVGATPTINGGISSASFSSAGVFYLSSTSGVRSLDASAEL